jgi:DNA replication licensing factor MCM4
MQMQADEGSDRRLARHLTSLFYENIPEHARALIPLEDLKEYIAFARTRVHPTIGEEAAPLLAQAYLDMRMMGQDPSGNVNRCVPHCVYIWTLLSYNTYASCQ